jgi:hypothetical protein
MTNITDLPIELLLDIVKRLVPNNPLKPVLGGNAAWADLNAYHGSIYSFETSVIDEMDPLPPSPVSQISPLLNLRL